MADTTTPNGEKITNITAPTEGEIKKVVVGEEEAINLDFDIEEAKVELVDVDLVLTWPDGSRLVLVSYGITMLMNDTAPMTVQNEVVKSEDLLSRVDNFVASDLPVSSDFTTQAREIPEETDEGGDEEDEETEATYEEPVEPVTETTTPVATPEVDMMEQEEENENEFDQPPAPVVPVNPPPPPPASGSSNASSTATAEIEGEPIPPNTPPVLTIRNLSPIDENSAQGTAVAEFSATDADVDDVLTFTVSGDPDFVISGNRIVVAPGAELDYEETTFRTVTLTVDDGNGGRVSETLTIELNNVNEFAPELTITNLSPIDENSPGGTLVADLSATDGDADETLTFSISGADASAFEVVGDQIMVRAGAELDFEANETLTFDVTVTDFGGLTDTQSITVTLNDINEAPTLDIPDFDALPENSPAGTTVFVFDAIDQDAGDTVTVTISGPDAALFEIDGNRVVVAPGADIDYESAIRHAITLTVTDAAGLNSSVDVDIPVADVNDVTPTLEIDNRSPINENSPGGTLVANLTVIDPDTNDSHTFTLSGADAGLFEVVGTQIVVRAGAILDFEARNTYQLTVTVTDAVGHNSTEPLTVTLTDVAEAPELTVDVVSGIVENSPTGTVVARFSATDQDAGDTISYSLSGPDAALFELTETGEIVLRAGAELDYEAGPTRSLTLTATDSTGLTDSESIVIELVDENDVTPTLNITNRSPINENSPGGTVAAEFTVIDPDTNDSHTYMLGGADADLFEIIDNQVVVRPGAVLDFETQAAFQLTITVTDAVGQNSTEALTIRLRDVAEAPELTAEVVPGIVENSPTGTVVARFSATDQDRGDTLTYSLSGPDAELFELTEAGEIVLRAGAELDYEAGPTRSITLTVTDSTGLTDSQSLIIALVDENDVTPTLSIDSLTPVLENSPAGTVVAEFSATDPDTNETLTYSLSGPDANLFTITNGTITVAPGVEIDYEAGATRSITLTVTDAVGHTDSETITVTILDENDVTPTLSIDSLTPVLENSPAGTVVAEFSATDPDTNETLTYSLSGPDANLFTITNGTITVAPGVEIDYEAGPTRSITLTVTDAVGHTDSETITVTILDENDVTPTLSIDSLTPVLENSPAGTAVAEFSATDPDTNESLAYSLSGPDANLFTIVNGTIAVAAGAEIDYEAGPTRSITLTVTDAVGHTDSETITVTILDENDVTPTLSIDSLTPVLENSPAGTVVAEFSATDPDTNETLTYSLSGPDANLFTITNGTITVAPGADIDYEAGPTRSITLTVTDAVGHTDSETITVTILDENDVTPTLSIDSLTPVLENSPAGTVVAEFSATDPDTNETLTYSLSGPDANLFTITNGTITVAPGVEIDYEAGPTRSITLTVTDAVGHTDSETITVTILDENDVTPTLSIDSLTPVLENSPAGTVVAEFSATDPDTNETLTYSLSGPDANLFTITNGTIAVAAGAEIDYEAGPTRSITLTVTDAVGHTDSETITVTILDENDVTPTLSIDSLTPVLENSPAGTVVAEFSATDPDTNETLTYSLSGPDANLFTITNGTITVAPGAEIDYEAGTTRSITLTVTDAVGHTDSETIVVTVLDENDVTPTLSIDVLNAVTENSPAGTVVAEFSATDPDTNETLTYSLSGPDANLFTITNGTITVAPGAEIDYEAATVRYVTLTVTDAAGASDSESLTVTIIDENDVTPTLEVTQFGAVAENSPSGTVVAAFSATDPDTNENLTFSLGGPNANLFAIQGDRIVVAPGANIDYEEGPTRSIILTVTDAGGNRASEALTVEIGDLNDVSPILDITNESPIDENSPAGTVVMRFTLTDPDTNDSHTYSLSGADAAMFEVLNDTVVLRDGAILDFEEAASRSFTITVTDAAGNNSSETITIIVADVNEAPTLTVTNNSPIAENSSAGTVVATLSATDPDIGDTINFTLTGADAGLFEVINGQVVLRQGAELDYEAGAERTFTVTATDTGGLETSEVVTIVLTDENDVTPTLSITTFGPIDEDQGAGTLLANFVTADPDTNDSHTYAISGRDSALVQIIGDNIRLAPGAELDFETNNTIEFTITVTDAAGQSSSNFISIDVNDVNETPTLSIDTLLPVVENSAAGTVVAEYSATDPDAGDTLTFALSGPDAALFALDNGRIVVAPGAEIDYESVQQLSVTLTVSDAAGLTDTQTLTIDILDENDVTPTLTVTTTGPIVENSPSGTVVATFSATDPDTNETLTYALNGADANLFRIVGDTIVLRPGAVLDYEEGPTRSFSVTVTDAVGHFDTVEVVIDVTDVNDVTPELTVVNLGPIEENSAAGTAVASFSAVDPDTEEFLTFALSGADANLFEIVNDQIVLRNGVVLDYEEGDTRSLVLTVTDDVGHVDSQAITIQLTDLNDVTPTLTVTNRSPITENSPGGTVVADFFAEDPDTNETLTYTLSGVNADLFEVVGNQIVVRAGADIDYEAGSTRSITLTVTDAVGHTDSQNLTITIFDENDVTPTLSVSNRTPIAENSVPGTLVAEFVTFDPDTNENLTYTLSGPDASLFAISGGRIVVAPGADIDYEDAPTRSITLTVTDAAGQTDSVDITVALTDLNDEAPELTITTLNTIDENSAPGTVVAEFSSSDRDFADTAVYTLSGPDAALFTIDNGRIVVAPGADIDYEVGTTRSITLTATDAGGNTDSETLTIVINDVNDVTPTLSIDSQTPINENAVAGTEVATFSATDPDTNETLTYSLSGPDAALFTIDNGRIVVAAGADLDFEDGPTRSVTLTVTDAVGHTDSETLTITLNDLNDEIPELTLLSQSAIIENSAPGTEVAAFATNDRDAGDTVTYALSGPDAALFAVENGRIVLAPGAQIDYESATSHSVTLTATDAAGNSDALSFTFAVTDVNDVTPTLTIDTQNAVTENAAAGTEVATFSATDPDTNETLTYALSGPDAALFVIDNGRIVVAAGADIDYETGTTRSITLTVTDAVGHTDSQTLTVAILDENDVTPTLTIDTQNAVTENAAAGTEVATFSAVDPDTNETLTYALSGPDAGLFTIDNGRIVVAAGADIDYEAGPTRSITLTVTDAVGHSDSQTLTVTILDENDVTPTLTIDSQNAINENAVAGTEVATFSAVDPDTNEALTFTLSGPDAALFAIDNGRIIVAPGADIDYEAGSTRSITLTVTDAVGHADSETLTIVINDLNDVTPTLTIDNQNAVLENSAAGTEVATFSVVDPDTNENLTYRLTGPDAALFAIDNGRIVVAAGADIDYEAGATRSVTLTVTDAVGHTDSETLTIAITDVNDVTPTLTIDSQNAINENAVAGTEVATFSATDPDTNETLTYTLSGPDAGLFTIDNGRIVVAAGADIDYEAGPTRSITLTVTDAVGHTDSETLTVQLININEHDPVISLTNRSPIDENAAVGTVVASFTASDADADSVLSYALGGTDAGLFEIVNGNIVVRAGASLDFEDSPTRSITLTVTDEGGRATTEAITVTLADLNDETPTLTVTAPATIAEDLGVGGAIASYTVADRDADDTLTVTLSGPDASLFEVSNGEIVLAGGQTLDYETNRTLDFTVTVTDAGGNNTSETVRVTVTNVDEFDPVLALNNNSPIAENSSAGTIVASYSATDADADETLTYELSGDGAAYFELDNGNIRLRSGVDFDFEATPSISTTLTVTSFGGRTDTVTFDVLLSNINEGPTLTVSGQRAIDENSAGGTVIANVATFDPDAGDTLTVALSGPDANLFTVSGGNLVVAPGADIDFEAGPTRTVTITVTDAAGLSDSQTLTIAINDLNDETPDLTVVNRSPIDENSPGGTVVATFTAPDADAGDTVTYSLTGADAAFFTITGETIVVKPGADLNFEVKSTYSVTLTATDTAGNASSETLSIALTDVNEAPNLTVSGVAPIDENASAGTVVGSFSTNDPDAGDTVTFELFGPDAALFEISGNTVVVRAGAELDFEAGDTRTVSVRATDSGGIVETGTITVTLRDVNEAPDLALTGQTPIDENSPAGTVVGTLASNDPDAGDTITYALSGPGASNFEIVNGQLVVKAGATLDFEAGSTRSLTITATDSGGLSDTLDVTVDLRDLNDETPTLTITNLSPVDENGPSGTPVARFTVSDADANNNFSYTLSGPDASFFAVSNGEIVIAPGQILNFEESATRTVTITVDDGAGNTDSETITITVNDVNDLPQLTVNATGPIDENSPGGTVVASFAATDEDVGDTITYTITGPDAAKYTISGNQVVVAGGADIDYETDTSHSINLVATDSQGGSSTEAITIQINPISEFDPTLSLTAIDSIEENSPSGTELATFIVTDADAGETLSYSFSGPNADLFVVDGNSVVVAPGAVLDYEAGPTVTATLTVTDSGGRAASQTFTINLIDQDEAPEITIENLNPIDENSPGGTRVATFSAFDLNGENMTFALEGQDSDLFEIVGDEIRVRDGVDLSFETAETRVFDLRVTNESGFSDAESITVTLRDVNEAPILTVAEPFAVAENTTGNPVVTTFAVLDEDIGDTLQLSLAGADAANFEIVGNEIRVRDGVALDFEGQGIFNFELVATDANGLEAREPIIFELSPVNEFDMVLENFDRGIIEHNSGAGTVVREWVIRDEDLGETYTYALSGEDAAQLRIVEGNSTIRVVVADGATLDYDEDPVVNYILTVTDQDGNTVSSGDAVAVSSSVDTPPEFAYLTPITIYENAEGGTPVLGFSGRDDSRELNLRYSLGGRDADMLQGLNRRFIVLRDGVDLDFETQPTIEFTLTVTDPGGQSYTETITVDVSNLSGSFVGTADDDILIGSSEEDSIRGLEGNDFLIGKEGDNTLDGGAGDDILVSGAGDELLVGGQGVDTVDYSEAVAAVTANLSSNTATSGGGGADTLNGIENLKGSAFDDTLTGDDGANTLDGGGGSDILIGGGGDDILLGDGSANVSHGAYPFNSTGHNEWTNGQSATGAGFGRFMGRYGGSGGEEFVSRTFAINQTKEYAIFEFDLLEIDSLDDEGVMIFINGQQIVATNWSTFNADEDYRGVVEVNGMTVFYDIIAGEITDNDFATNWTDQRHHGRLVIQNPEPNIRLGFGSDIDQPISDESYGIDNVYVISSDNFGATHTDIGGNDILTGGAGNDTLDGGAGNADVAVFSGTWNEYQIDDLGGGVYRVTDLVEGRDGIDTVTNIEVLRFTDRDIAPGAAGNQTPTGISFTVAAAIAEYVASGGTIGGASDPTGALVATAQIADPDGAFDTATYALTDDLGGRFVINAQTGEITVADGTLIDFETSGGSYTLNVTATDGGGNTVTQTLTITITDGGGTFTGDGTDDIVIGTSENDTIDGGDGANVLDGGAGDDILTGGRDGDILIGGAGDDILNGGDGIDTADYSGATTGVTVDLGITTAQNTGEGTDTLTSIERVIGSNFDDTLTGGAGDDRLEGGDGNDTLTGGGGLDFLSGGEGDDVLTFAGTDLTGQTGLGGAGNDRVVFTDYDATTVLTGLDGIETLSFDYDSAGAATDLNLTAEDIVAMTDDNNELVIELAANQTFTLDEDSSSYSRFDLGNGVTRYFAQTTDANGEQVVAEIEVHAA